MIMMFLMFSSGVFFDVNAIADPVLRDALFTYNPIAFLLDAYRQVLMERSMYDLEHLTRLGGIVLVALFAMHVVFHTGL